MHDLMRLDQLLHSGFTIPIGRLGRWREDALLTLRDEWAVIHRERAPDGR